MTFSFAIESRPLSDPSGREAPELLRVISPNYFRTMGIALLSGRDFQVGDRAGGHEVIIINDALARLHWPDQNPVGQRISFAGPAGPWKEIVGVVGSTRMSAVDEPPAPAVYLPHAQKSWDWMSWMTMIVRPEMGRKAKALTPHLQAAVWDLDPQLAIQRIATVTELYGGGLARRQFALILLLAFAATAVLLGMLGIYGVLSYTVSQRREELGVRIALGARSVQIVGLVLRQTLLYSVVGIVLGTLAALVLSTSLRTLLYQVSPADPLTFATVSCLLLVVAILAALIPAHRATRIDPLESMRRS